MRSFLSYLKYILIIHLFALIIFSSFRVYLFANSYELLQPHSTGEVLLISKAFLKGLWFDNVTCCYISIVPLLIRSEERRVGKEC